MRYARLLNPNEIPKNGFPYTDPDTGHTSRFLTLAGLIGVARLHREANGLPVPPDFDKIVETQICALAPDGCVNLDGSPNDASCVYRGAELRQEGCDTCGGVRAKIMACALHGECSLFKHDVGVQRCGDCKDRVSTVLPE